MIKIIETRIETTEHIHYVKGTEEDARKYFETSHYTDAQDTITKDSELEKVEYQDECDVWLDIEGNPVPDKYACITSDNADYFVQDYEGDNYG